MQHFKSPLFGPSGESLFMDIAQFGNQDAKKILICVSGCHGPEAYAGSAIQAGWAENFDAEKLDDDVSVILIHALNPYGFAWGTRTNENLVDVNRNFIDHSRPYPESAEYEKIHDILVPPEWGQDGETKIKERLAVEFTTSSGMDIPHHAQHSNPKGVHFGGTSPSWSNKVVSSIIRDKIQLADDIILIDCHTGMGEYGQAMLMLDENLAADKYDIAEKYFGDLLEEKKSTAPIEPQISGTLCDWIGHLFPKKSVLGMTLEYGICPVEEILPVALHCHWLAANDKLSLLESISVRKAHINIFTPLEESWRQGVCVQSAEIMDLAVKYLTRNGN